jgi:hypothetical protein
MRHITTIFLLMNLREGLCYHGPPEYEPSQRRE